LPAIDIFKINIRQLSEGKFFVQAYYALYRDLLWPQHRTVSGLKHGGVKRINVLE